MVLSGKGLLWCGVGFLIFGLALLPTAWAMPVHADTLETVPTIVLSKSVMPTSEVDLGEVLTYTLVFTYTGEPLATSARLTDTLPAVLMFESFVPDDQVGVTYNDSSHQVEWADELDRGESRTITFTTVLTNSVSVYGQEITNTAELLHGDGLASGSAVFSVVEQPVLSIVKSVIPTTGVGLGDVVTYTLSYSNTRGGVAHNVSLSDTLPAAVDFGGFVAGEGSHSEGVVTWTTGRLLPGIEHIIVFTGTLGYDESWYGQTITNTAELTADNAEPQLSSVGFDVVKRYFTYLPVTLRDYSVFVDGSFELDLGWLIEERPLPVKRVDVTRDGLPFDGSHAVILGSPDYGCGDVPLGHASVSQVFTVPDNATKLSFRYIVWSQDASVSEDYDRFEVYLNDSLEFEDGNKVNANLACDNWWRVPGTGGDNRREDEVEGWALGEIDLVRHRGRNVAVSFRNYSRYDNWYNTYTYLDDVRIEVE